MNKVILSGRLTKDPEIRYGGSDKKLAIASFSLAVDTRKKDDTDFFDCVCFGKTAEFIEKYVIKGTKILIDGEVHNNNYTDKNGNKHYGMKFIVNQVEFAESKKDRSEPADEQPSAPDGFMHIPDEVRDEELPFN